MENRSEEQYLNAHEQGFHDGVSAAAAWLRHIDRLEEIPGAKAAMPLHNPLWDASVMLEQKLGKFQMVYKNPNEEINTPEHVIAEMNRLGISDTGREMRTVREAFREEHTDHEDRLAEIQERANHPNHGGWVNRPKTAHEDVSWLLTERSACEEEREVIVQMLDGYAYDFAASDPAAARKFSIAASRLDRRLDAPAISATEPAQPEEERHTPFADQELEPGLPPPAQSEEEPTEFGDEWPGRIE